MNQPTDKGDDAAQVDRIALRNNQEAMALLGERNGNLRRLERETGAQVHSRGSEITILGTADAVVRARRVIDTLLPLARSGRFIEPADVTRAASLLERREGDQTVDVSADTILITNRSRPIAARTAAQKAYVDAIRQHNIVFGVGPAGTGKTYLAMALAVRALMERRVKRIVLTRPAVEAGEHLGFLPGSMEEKVSPYLRPLHDALHDMMELEKVEQLVVRGSLEIAPLAFMRGRTLNDSFVILDEAQNTTCEQMHMFLTRLGRESTAVITGDVTQVDLPDSRRSGLDEAIEVLEGVAGIAFSRFSDADVMRHPLVQKVIRAYDRYRSGADTDRPGRG